MFNPFKKITTEVLIDLIKTLKKQASYVYSANDLSGINEYDALKKVPLEGQRAMILQLNELMIQFGKEQAKKKFKSHDSDDINYYGKNIALAIQSGLLRRKLDYNEEEWMNLFRNFRACANELSSLSQYYFSFHLLPVNYAIKQIEYFLKKREPSKELTAFIHEMLEWEEFKGGDRYYYGSDLKKASKKLQALLRKEGEEPAFVLKTNDIGNQVMAIVNGITKEKQAFHRIFNLATGASNAKPPQKFRKEVTALQDKIGSDAYRKVVHQILSTTFNHAAYSKTTTYSYNGGSYDHTEMLFLCQPSQQFIKGMVWTVERFSDKETIRIITKLCEKTYTKIPGRGPAAASIGNACVYVLGNMRGKDGLGALSRLKLKVRQNNVKKTIDKYLVEGAKKYNVSVEELKEMAVPDFHLDKGSKTIGFEDYALKVSIEGRKVTQQWIKPDGQAMKSVPSLVKKNAALAKKLKEVRKEVKEIQKVYSAQKQRIDNQFILDRTWDFASFQKYYMKHGLVYPVANKLIWSFKQGDQATEAIFIDGQWKDANGQVVDWIGTKTAVKLWHPVGSGEETIIKWRERIIELEWKQPIKQAFREIYILTDAEINTINYSNRMAAHILKQHQFSTLANLRGWKYSLIGAFDHGMDSFTCYKYLPEYGITAEYWINEMLDDESWNDSGIWLYVATDQVKFKDAAGNTIDMVNVPKMVFTEIMRDVDMFVGVCSVGNDPQWMDNNGERQAYRDYWTSYSFGDLTEIAKTRKGILERLLPRLKKIRDKTTIDGKFLKVEGKLRTYKIHIGSSNILMEPNDQYLCIVPSRSAENSTDRLFIPFEGDKGLSIVLSKAFLLAEDHKITDKTITSQINR